MPFLLFFFFFCSLSPRPSSLHTVTDQSHFPARAAQRIFLFLDVGARKLKSKHAGRCLKNVGWQLITMTTRIPEDCSCLVRPRRRVPQGCSFHPPPPNLPLHSLVRPQVDSAMGTTAPPPSYETERRFPVFRFDFLSSARGASSKFGGTSALGRIKGPRPLLFRHRSQLLTTTTPTGIRRAQKTGLLLTPGKPCDVRPCR